MFLLSSGGRYGLVGGLRATSINVLHGYHNLSGQFVCHRPNVDLLDGPFGTGIPAGRHNQNESSFTGLIPSKASSGGVLMGTAMSLTAKIGE